MSEPTLLVPMLLDGLLLTHGQTVVAPACFDRLPFVANHLDRNIGAPFLASTTHPDLFADDTVELGAGVHLHWTLPRVLRTARVLEGAPGRLQFPRVPDQWLVIRTDSIGQTKTWRVDSSYAWPAASPDEAIPAATIWPWKITQDGDGSLHYDITPNTPPWRCVGRSWNELLNRPGDANGAERVELRADGWGDPTFSAYYPACRTVFGFHDPNPDDVQSYAVYGWFGDDTIDPVGVLYEECSKANKLDTLRARITSMLGWSYETNDLPRRFVCVGKLSRKNFTAPVHEQSSRVYRLAIGSSGTEALAVLLADDVARMAEGETGIIEDSNTRRERLERHLQAVLLAPELKGHSVDIGHALDDLRLRREFAAETGGTIWVLHARQTDPGADDTIELPAELATELDDLNTAQENLDRRIDRVEALREQVYSDWYRAIKTTDPTSSFAENWVLAEHDPKGALDADDIYRHLRDITLDKLVRAEQGLQEALEKRNALKSKIEAAVAAHNAQPNAPQWALDAIPAPPFYTPNDLAVALVGSSEHTRDRWGDEGLARTSSGDLQTIVRNLTWHDEQPVDRPELGEIDLSPLTLDPDLELEHVHMFSMQWQVEFGGVATNPIEGADYSPDWLEKPPAERNATDVLQGTAYITQSASTVLENALLSYLRQRLSESVVAILEGEDHRDEAAVLHPLTASLCPPPGAVWRSWAQVEGVSEINAEMIRTHYDAIDLWAREYTHVEALVAASEALSAYPATLADGMARRYGFRADGPIARAIERFVAKQDAAYFSEKLELPRSLAEGLAGKATWADILAVCAPWKAAPIAALLRAVEEHGDLTEGDTEVPTLLDQPFVFGLSDGGALAAAMLEQVNHTAADMLLETMGLRDEIVAAIVDARPVSSLVDLASLQGVDVSTFARLLAAVEDAHVGRQLPALPAMPPRGTAMIDPLCATLEAWRALDRQPNALVHTLDGLHAALLQWDTAPQLPVADPVGFADYRRFAEEIVRPTVKDARRRAPRPDAGFYPLRRGKLKLDRLRLIDTFGQYRDVDASAAIAPKAWQSGAGDFHAVLPPRITQAARVNLRWLASDGHGQLWTPHPASTPICGWVIADTLQEEVVFHAANGALLGSLDTEGRWRVAPGGNAPIHPADIDDLHLRRFVLMLADCAERSDEDQPSPVSLLIDQIEIALEEIHPATNPNDEALALLLSRPLALVRIALSLELQAPPVTRQDLASLVKTLNGAPHDTLGFEDVCVSLQIGETARQDDGVVVWWSETAEGNIDPVAHMPHRDDSRVYTTLNPNASPLQMVMLVDPMAAIHVSSALLPPAVLQLPAAQCAAALSAIELRTYSGPHLTPRGQMEMPIVQHSGWQTSMLLRDPVGWSEFDDAQRINRADLEAWLDPPADAWQHLVSDGILELLPGQTNLARLVPGHPDHPLTLEQRLAAYPAPAALAKAMQSAIRQLRPPATSLSFVPLELRETWFRLRRTES